MVIELGDTMGELIRMCGWTYERRARQEPEHRPSVHICTFCTKSEPAQTIVLARLQFVDCAKVIAGEPHFRERDPDRSVADAAGARGVKDDDRGPRLAGVG